MPYILNYSQHGIKEALFIGEIDQQMILIACGVRDLALSTAATGLTKEWVTEYMNDMFNTPYWKNDYVRKVAFKFVDWRTFKGRYRTDIIVYAVDAEQKANRLAELVSNPNKDSSEHHREMGLLLGYRADLVEGYVANHERRMREAGDIR